MMATVLARIDDTLKRQFEDRVVANGRTVSEQLRILISEYVEQPSASPPVEIDAGNAALEKLTIRLPAFLREAAKQRAVSSGMTTSRWIAALVQSNLLRQPVMTDSELEALRRTNYELSAVGRNVNQMAKALNQARHETDRAKLDTLTVMADTIGRTRETIRALVRASRNVWNAD